MSHALDQSAPAWLSEAHYQQPVMGSRLITSDIGEIEVLCDEKTGSVLRGAPYHRILLSSQALTGNGIDVVSRCREYSNQGPPEDSRRA
jgi:hypothetical protein